MPNRETAADRVDPVVLHQLMDQGEAMTYDMLARACGHPPATVAAAVARLINAGCDIDQHPQQGLRLRRSGLGTWASYLGWHRPGRQVSVYARTSSTQDTIRQLVDARGLSADGAVAVADEQTAGRGRLGRRWVAPPQSAVLMSRALVRPIAEKACSPDRLMLASAVAVVKAIDIITGPLALDVKIRWPNDILVDGRKLAGILVERFSTSASVEAAILGIGINVALTAEQIAADQPGLCDSMTSLAMCGHHVDRLVVLAQTLAALDDAIDGDDDLVCQWRSRNTLAGRITLQHDGCSLSGQVINLDPEAGLILRCDNGSIVYLPGATTSVLDANSESQ